MYKFKSTKILYFLSGIAKRTFVLFLVFVFSFNTVNSAPLLIQNTGRLLDDSGNLLGSSSGDNYCFRFSFYDDPNVGSGTKLWPAGTPSTTTVNVTNGIFSAKIGDTASGGDTLNFDFSSTNEIYLNTEVAESVGSSCVGVASFETLGPRQRILSSAYALDAQALQGFTPSQTPTGDNIPVLDGGDLSLAGMITSGGLSLTLPSSAEGDIYYRNSSGNLERLPIGAQGEALVVSNNDLPVWQALPSLGDMLKSIYDTNDNSIIDVASGGTGANTLNDLITLSTHTVGNFVATLADAGSGRLTITGSGSENAGVTIDIADLGISTDKIANDAVTFAKIQNITDNRLLGRSAGSNGDAQEISIGNGLSLSSGTLTTSLNLNDILSADNTNSIDNTNYAQVWDWSTLTTQTGLTFSGSSTMTTGSILSLDGATYVHTSATTGDTMKLSFTDASTNASGTSSTSGLNINSTINTTGAGTKNVQALNVSSPTLTTCTDGDCVWSGLKVSTQSTGALATITQNAINVNAVGVALGNLNGLNISSITNGAGTQNAILLGDGWDNSILSEGQLIVKTEYADTAGMIFGSDTKDQILTIDTTNDRVQIGDGAGAVSPGLLVLDTKNTTGDGAGINGGMYYNSFDEAFRCYRAGAWENCGQHQTFTEYLSDGIPGAPPDGSIRMFAKTLGGRAMPAFIESDGVNVTLQSSFGRNKITMYQPASTTVLSSWGPQISPATAAAVATSAAPAVSSTNAYSRRSRLDYYVATPATTAVAGIRSSPNNQLWRGDSAGLGGFFFVHTWGYPYGIDTSTPRAFSGLSDATGVASDVNPSSLTNILGVGWDKSDTNISFIHNDASGTATKVDLGASFPVPTVRRSDVYELTMFAKPNDDKVYYEFSNLATNVTTSGYVDTDLPANTVFLNPRGWVGVGGTSSDIGYGFINLYTEAP